MTHLTTIKLTRNARGLTRDAQAMHRTIAHDCGRVLWALPDQHTLLIQHDQPVQWTHALDGLIDSTYTRPVTTPGAGAQIRYALIGNPTRCTKPTGAPRGTRGKRRALPEDQWDDWLRRHLDGPLHVETVAHDRLPVAHGQKHTMRTTHYRVAFTGHATVTNPDQLETTLTHGVGPGKAYGCGLLILQEVGA